MIILMLFNTPVIYKVLLSYDPYSYARMNHCIRRMFNRNKMRIGKLLTEKNRQ